MTSPATGATFSGKCCRASILIWVMIAMVPLTGLCTLAVDWGRVQLAKTEMQRCADAAARAAVFKLPNQTTARSQAVSVAALNPVENSTVALQTADVEFGIWNTTTLTFALNTTSPNAVRVTVRRIAARGNAVPLAFGALISKSSIDVQASAIALQTGHRVELVGLNSMTVQNNAFGGTYSSSTTTYPTHSTVIDGATAASNGAINVAMNEQFSHAILGPSGSSNMTTTDSTVTLTQALSFPLTTAPSATYSSMTVNSGTYYIAGGTYYCDDLTIHNGCSLIFTGPTTIYFTGNVKFNGDITMAPQSRVPGDLKIYHTGTGSFGSATANDVEIVADMYCPGCDFAVKNNAVLYGRFVFKTINAKNNLDYYYDEMMTPLYAGSGGGAKLVK